MTSGDATDATDATDAVDAVDATDVVVVGGGALGLSTALHCALLGRSVVLVERREVGSQASGRAAGLFKSVQADALRTRLARRSIEKALSFEEWTGVPLDVRRSGALLVARTTGHQAMLRSEVVASRGWGVEVGELTPTGLRDRCTFYVPTGAEVGVWCPEDVYVEEPTWLVRAYADACVRHGVQVADHEQVLDVTVTGGSVDGVVTDRRRIRAAHVVDAAGAWVRQVAACAGADVAVAPVRHQLLVTEPTASVAAADPIVRVVDAAVYLRPARGGLMVGGFEAEPLPVDPRAQPASFGTDDVALDAAVMEGFAKAVAAQVPSAGGPVAEHRGGLFTMSPDGRFVVGPVPGVRGLWVLSGCNGSGFSSSPALGEELAAWIVRGEPTGDLSPLAPDRFAPLADTELVERGTWQYAHYYDPAGTSPT